jgi:hypothetical protein
MQTFIVRLQQPNEGPAELRGVVDEVASGARLTFRDGGELLEILGRRNDEGGAPADQDRHRGTQ